MWPEATQIGAFDISNHFTIFRNPREFSTNENQILSPVDGKVVVIEEVYEGEYYKDKRRSLYSCHLLMCM
jgi:phosphatidylserine decarboxylase